MWKFSRETKGFEIAKVNSRCFCWFPAAMLVPIRRGTNMASHTKLCNFPWYIFSNNSIRRYRTALWLSHVVYVSLFYNISISWLYLLNGWGFYFFTCVTMCEVKTTYIAANAQPTIARYSTDNRPLLGGCIDWDINHQLTDISTITINQGPP